MSRDDTCSFCIYDGLHHCNDLQFIGEFWPVTYERSEVDLMMFSGESGTKNVNCQIKRTKLMETQSVSRCF